MTRARLIALAAGGSAALLLGAYTFELAGYAPCELCLWQRWPHGAAIVIGILALWWRGAPLPVLGAVAAAATAAVGAYHAGVERGLFAGPDSCTSGPVGGISPDALLEQILNAPLIRCDEIAWQLAGVSMAGWNAILSALLVLVWLGAVRAARVSAR